jgi:hypothetical protein
VADPLNSPLMLQYRDIKSRHQDAILFFRMGDFYEMFFDDAERAAKLLSITLTSRGDGIPLAGVPVKAAAEYLRQLVGAGLRVAICEQVEDPKLAKGIVRREVIETITPGAVGAGGSPAGPNNSSRGGRSPPLQREGGTGSRGPDGRPRRRRPSTGEFCSRPSPDALRSAQPVAPAEVAVRRTLARGRRDAHARERWGSIPCSRAGARPPLQPRLAGRPRLVSDDDPAVEPRAPSSASRVQPGGLKRLRRPGLRRSRTASGSTR